MAQKRGLIEIRLDRRQAFYAIVGSLLIVSVAFVVGLIGGQRMQLTAHDQPNESPKNGLVGLVGEVDSAEEAVAEDETYTFYEELAVASPRPLLMPSSGGIGQPEESYRVLERNPNVESLLLAPEGQSPEEQPTEEQSPREQTNAEPSPPPAPAGQQPSEPPAVAQPSAPEPAPAQNSQVSQAASTPNETDDAAAPPQRRLVRVNRDQEESVDDFGYYTVVAGLFPAFSEANDLRIRLRQAGHEAIVTIVSTGGPDRQYRVQVGSFTRRNEANNVAADLSLLGLDASVEQEG